jgi:hypothetical protein
MMTSLLIVMPTCHAARKGRGGGGGRRASGRRNSRWSGAKERVAVCVWGGWVCLVGGVYWGGGMKVWVDAEWPLEGGVADQPFESDAGQQGVHDQRLDTGGAVISTRAGAFTVDNC